MRKLIGLVAALSTFYGCSQRNIEEVNGKRGSLDGKPAIAYTTSRGVNTIAVADNLEDLSKGWGVYIQCDESWDPTNIVKRITTSNSLREIANNRRFASLTEPCQGIAKGTNVVKSYVLANP